MRFEYHLAVLLAILAVAEEATGFLGWADYKVYGCYVLALISYLHGSILDKMGR